MRRTVPAVAALGVGLALTLTGCFGNPLEQLTEGIVEGGVEQMIEDQTCVDWLIETYLASDGDIVLSSSAGGVFSVIINVASYDEVQRAFDEMLLAGYAEISTLDLGEGAITRIYENTTWNVGILGAQNDDGTATMQYTVTPVTQ